MTMMLPRAVLPLLLAACLPFATLADKDTNYYPGYSNPNVDKEMYWNDAINVLQDINKFESLYIKYHGCVWSNYGEGAENAEIGCGYDSYGGDEYWYLGRTQCFRANVAYSLYGILADEDYDDDGSSSSNNKNSMASSNCNQDTYMNSFFTTMGVEAFANPLGIDTGYETSDCTSTYVGGDNGGYGSDHYSASSSYSSITVGCSASQQFVTAKYLGAYCSGQNYVGTLDQLSDFNDAVQSQSCVKVLDKTNEYFSVAESILANSTACSVRQYPKDCPDPFGLKDTYTRTLETASASTSPTIKENFTKALPFITAALAFVGVVLFGLACYVYRNASQHDMMYKKDLEAPMTSTPVVQQVPIQQQQEQQQPIPVLHQMSIMSQAVLSAFSGIGGKEEEEQQVAPPPPTQVIDQVEQTRSVDVSKDDAAAPGYNAPNANAGTGTPDTTTPDSSVGEEEGTKTSDNKTPPPVQQETMPPPVETALGPPPPAPSPKKKPSSLIDSAEAASAILAQKKISSSAAAPAPAPAQFAAASAAAAKSSSTSAAAPKPTTTTTQPPAAAADKKKKPRLSRLFSSKKSSR